MATTSGFKLLYLIWDLSYDETLVLELCLFLIIEFQIVISFQDKILSKSQ